MNAHFKVLPRLTAQHNYNIKEQENKLTFTVGTVLGCFSSFNVKCLRNMLCRPVPFWMLLLWVF